MYDWRNMTSEERSTLLERRKGKLQPWHSPPHRFLPGKRSYILSASCFEHAPVIASNSQRLDDFTQNLLEACQKDAERIYAWCILPNHYHILVQTSDLKTLLAAIGRLHGRTSYAWNIDDNAKGRQVWFNCVDREMRSHRHLMASINYHHHNPVKHGYVERWQDWPWSSAARFLETMGRERASQIWREYPIKDYGLGWDD